MNIQDCSISTASDLVSNISDLTLFIQSPVFFTLDDIVRQSILSSQLDLVEQLQSLLSYLRSVAS